MSEQNIFWISLPRNAQMSNAILQYFETFHWNSETDMWMCHIKQQWLDTIENVYQNFCRLIFRYNIIFDFQVLFLHYSECECLSEQNIFWVVGKPDFRFPPIKECKNVKSNITILWDVSLEFRNWYPFIRPESDHCIPLLVTIPTPVK